VLNLARDHNRRGLMSLRHFEALTPEASPDALDDRIVLDEQQAAVVDALQALSPQQRDCLVLRFYLELSEQETADTLGISPNSVKTHCRRGSTGCGSVWRDGHERRTAAARDLHRADTYEVSPDLFARVQALDRGGPRPPPPGPLAVAWTLAGVLSVAAYLVASPRSSTAA
jgi:hypothetical protein